MKILIPIKSDIRWQRIWCRMLSVKTWPFGYFTYVLPVSYIKISAIWSSILLNKLQNWFLHYWCIGNFRFIKKYSRGYNFFRISIKFSKNVVLWFFTNLKQCKHRISSNIFFWNGSQHYIYQNLFLIQTTIL